jgi:hypothetical protein
MATAVRFLHRCETWPDPEEAACAALVSLAVGLMAPRTHGPDNLRRILRCLAGGRAGAPLVAALEHEWVSLLQSPRTVHEPNQ